MSLQVPNHKLIEKLDQGAMGEVWLGEHLFQARRAAIKILKDLGHGSDLQHRSFLRECQVLASFDHPNIVKIYDSGMVEGQAYLVMEHLNGGTLLQRMQKGGVSVAESIALTVQIANALAVVHQQQIVHRDLKPANIMLREASVPVLLDFGVAHLGEQSTIFGGFAGTPAYMSPELIDGRPIDGRSDLYALGTIFWELLTGRRPYPGGGREQIFAQHLTSPLPFLPPELAALQPITDRLLAKSPDDRYPSATAFVEDLRRVFLSAESLRLQIGYAGSDMAWTSQLRSLGFVLDREGTREVRIAQGDALKPQPKPADPPPEIEPDLVSLADIPESLGKLHQRLRETPGSLKKDPRVTQYKALFSRLIVAAKSIESLRSLAREAEAARNDFAGRADFSELSVLIRDRLAAAESAQWLQRSREAAARSALLPPVPDNALELLRTALALAPDSSEAANWEAELAALVTSRLEAIAREPDAAALNFAGQAVAAFPSATRVRELHANLLEATAKAARLAKANSELNALIRAFKQWPGEFLPQAIDHLRKHAGDNPALPSTPKLEETIESWLRETLQRSPDGSLREFEGELGDHSEWLSAHPIFGVLIREAATNQMLGKAKAAASRQALFPPSPDNALDYLRQAQSLTTQSSALADFESGLVRQIEARILELAEGPIELALIYAQQAAAALPGHEQIPRLLARLEETRRKSEAMAALTTSLSKFQESFQKAPVVHFREALELLETHGGTDADLPALLQLRETFEGVLQAYLEECNSLKELKAIFGDAWKQIQLNPTYASWITAAEMQHRRALAESNRENEFDSFLASFSSAPFETLPRLPKLMDEFWRPHPNEMRLKQLDEAICNWITKEALEAPSLLETALQPYKEHLSRLPSYSAAISTLGDSLAIYGQLGEFLSNPAVELLEDLADSVLLLDLRPAFLERALDAVLGFVGQVGDSEALSRGLQATNILFAAEKLAHSNEYLRLTNTDSVTSSQSDGKRTRKRDSSDFEDRVLSGLEKSITREFVIDSSERGLLRNLRYATEVGLAESANHLLLSRFRELKGALRSAIVASGVKESRAKIWQGEVLHRLPSTQARELQMEFAIAPEKLDQTSSGESPHVVQANQPGERKFGPMAHALFWIILVCIGIVLIKFGRMQF